MNPFPHANLSALRCLTVLCAGVAMVAAMLLSTVAWAQVPPGTGMTPPKVPSKACIAAGRKLAREQQSLDAAKADLEHFTKVRAGCNSKTACARADSSIAGINKRIPRYESRLRTFRGNQEQACVSG